ncbi:MAG: hypothetical protein HY372_02870 [Candidatus Andersenbacteria bacterium]|nr:hypothetical protein [Candidatus Andersenbacteria bacterium]
MQIIPGVTLKIYKQNRELTPDEGGYVGKLYSGYAVLEATVAPGERMIGLQQQSRDRYSLARDWMQLSHVPADPSPLVAKRFWYTTGPIWYATVGFALPQDTKVYRHKVALDANHRSANSFVPYPNNLLALAQYERNDNSFTNVVKVWKFALIAQHDDQYFVSVQQVYRTTAHQNGDRPCLPRLKVHPTLETILAAHLPDGVSLPPASEYQDEEGPALKHLHHNEGLVTCWYESRGVGILLTRRGKARVNWRAVPGRPRKAYLVPGEVVTFERLEQPAAGDVTRYRPHPRKSSFALQAHGVVPKNSDGGLTPLSTE